MANNQIRQATGRRIGPIGTTSRVVLGVPFIVFGALGGRFTLINGHPHVKFEVASLALGLVALPVVLTASQWLRSRRVTSQLMETGPLASTINVLLFALLVSTVSRPAISFVGFAALVFYGASMLIAAVRGYAGCEVLAFSNWLLRRDDQVGCLVLSPIDALEQPGRR